MNSFRCHSGVRPLALRLGRETNRLPTLSPWLERRTNTLNDSRSERRFLSEIVLKMSTSQLCDHVLAEPGGSISFQKATLRKSTQTDITHLALTTFLVIMCSQFSLCVIHGTISSRSLPDS